MRTEDFKHAVGKFPTGVCVITTEYDNKYWGLTANSFSSVSLKPPLISFCLDKNSGSFHAFTQANDVIVNILSLEQIHLAKHFATKSDDKFRDIEYRIDANNRAPSLDHCCSVIKCTKHNMIDAGDHYIFVLEAKEVIINDKDPLVYFHRNFTELP